MNKTQDNRNNHLTGLSQGSQTGKLSEGSKFLLLVTLHIPLALLIRNVQLFATLHGWITLAIGCWVALTSEDIKKVIPIVVYITGAEVLWRMTGANVFWEFGKYATVAILVLALLKNGKIKKAGFPLTYFVLLLPSIFLTVDVFGLGSITRSAISFNLSGPLAVCICMIYFRQIKTDHNELGTWLKWAIYPIIGILTLAAYSTLTATEIRFGTQSIFTTSGGFGPNQVSAILGLGAMILIMLAITEEKSGARNGYLLLAIVLLTQSVLTFSRGGVLNVLIAIPLALFHLLKSPNNLMRGIFVILIIALAAYSFLLPQLDKFTGGTLEARFSDLDMTGREDIAKADLKLWFDNPLLGVGPGMSQFRRAVRQGSQAHTEYSRIVAEHGSAGLLSLLILLLLLFNAYLRAPDAISRAWVVALAAWPLLEMTHAAMRVVSISFMLGLVVVGWDNPTASISQDSSKIFEKNKHKI